MGPNLLGHDCFSMERDTHETARLLPRKELESPLNTNEGVVGWSQCTSVLSKWCAFELIGVDPQQCCD